jgi:heat induced stress protein YflT
MRNPGRFEPRFAETARRAAWDVVASYDSYTEAERAVDHLADSGFPVEHTEIVGRDLRLVEQVTGRLTRARAAAAGAGAGAWWGLFIGLLVGLFTTGPEWLGLVLGGILIGAAWGAIFGFAAHWMTGGRRDFSSATGIVASRYDVTVSDEYAERARQLLSRLP